MTVSEKLKIGILSALVPTVIAILLIAVIAAAVNFISEMGLGDIARKTEHYSQLAEYAPENATVFFGDSITTAGSARKRPIICWSASRTASSL